jgi:GTPase SAR1 family protein
LWSFLKPPETARQSSKSTEPAIMFRVYELLWHGCGFGFASGYAGSGKTTLMQRLVSHVQSSKKRGYVLNLDPAVMSLPFTANIDIRDTVNYKNVMKEYHLGPNGGILTSLNLFATKFDEVMIRLWPPFEEDFKIVACSDFNRRFFVSFLLFSFFSLVGSDGHRGCQVVGLVEARAANLDYVLVDTPGQIEIFTWSASGAIVVEAFASCFPTVVCYVVDTPRSVNPVTFMSNMLYACGILYKTRLPLLLAFNKVDVAKHQFALEVWTNPTADCLYCRIVLILFVQDEYIIWEYLDNLMLVLFDATSGPWLSYIFCKFRFEQLYPSHLDSCHSRFVWFLNYW